ncbi:MAG: type I secretion system permease/ATPase [Planktomarina sp.]
MNTSGGKELRLLRRKFNGLYVWIAVFSLFMNVLMLTGPIYMMQVYDRVLSAKSEATLVALSLVVVFLYTVMGSLDIIRSRVLSRIAGRFQSAMDGRVFKATMTYTSEYPMSKPHPGLQDLEAVQRLMSSPAISACFDLPWVPLFLVALWVFHPLLFALALCGGLVLIMMSALNQRLGQKHTIDAVSSSGQAHHTAETMRQNADVIRAMGMSEKALSRWRVFRDEALYKGLQGTDIGGGFTSVSRSLRLMLQSAMLGLGAWLVLHGNLSAGAMIAASFLLGRALSPIEALIGQWVLIHRGRAAWASLTELLENIPEPTPAKGKSRPTAHLQIKEATVIPPGERQAILRMISFDLEPGQACGVIGPSGAGKSSLAKTLTGLWHPAAGSVRLDGLSLDQYGEDTLGRHIGYLPQSVGLFDGTIAQNIARLADEPDMKKVQSAAARAGALEMINALPDGFNTVVRSHQHQLSGGQVQRIGLARALFGNPILVILDEPNANLDNDGTAALNAAIKDLKKRGCLTLVMAHRPAAIQECDVLLMIENGVRKAFGPKEQVLRKVVQNHARIGVPSSIGGAA